MARSSRATKQTPELFELRVTVSRSIADDVGAFLVESGAGGIVEESAGKRAVLVVYGESAPALEALASLARGALGKRATVEVRKALPTVSGWETAWMEHLEPVRVSRTLALIPLASGTEPDAARTDAVWLEPALAFGFGEHPTTRMAARVVERLARAGGAERLLDVGTGSGVLAIVAARSGTLEALGVDIDTRAVVAARRNARLNGVGGQCRFSKKAVGALPDEYDLVVANVDRNTLLALASVIVLRLASRGALVVTGVLDDDRADIEARYRELGLEPAFRMREGGFLLVCFRRGARVRKGGAASPRARRAPPRIERKKSRTTRSR